MTPPRHPLQPRHRQRGAAFIVMLVIMIMGLSFYLVSALSKVSLQTARNEASGDMLAQAKEVVVGYMLRDKTSTPPGWLQPPDVLNALSKETPGNYDGQWETEGCFNVLNAANTPPYTPLTTSAANMRCLGRLPWSSLGMSIGAPSENDPLGIMPWFAYSRNLMDGSTKINSDLLTTATYPWLKVYDMNGTLLSDRVAFVIIIPGPALPNQNRPLSPSLAGPDQYLDKISLPAGCTGAGCTTTYSNYDLTETFVTGNEHRWMADPADPSKQIEDPTYQFNDKLMYVTIDDLMPLIEKRIAREVKACLDDYANATGNTGHKYPWAALVSDSSNPRPGTYNVLFGRMAETPNTNTSSGGTPSTADLALQNKILAVQTALNTYLSNPTSTNLSNLRSKGDVLKDFAQGAPYYQSITDPARAAGITADNCTGMSCTALLTTQIQSALNAIPASATTDSTLPSAWASIASCNQLFNVSSYWPDWRDLVFYQVANGFQPGGAGACTANTTCLSVSGSGNTNAGTGTYRATVVIAGKKLTGQNRPSTANPPSDYLEAAGSNTHDSSAGATPSVNFTTYKPSDANYQTVNDLVVCLDGKNNCK